ncbi:hypothetical protein [Catenulispora subtropica]|uniref:Uncharacterized protein n=1 Tax=Catenulispora subtropica TaxID=450798 RepID=A0ABP5EK96_9ACTN
MTLDAVGTPSETVARRFFLVDYLPTYGFVLFVLVLGWAGAPARHPVFARAWHTAAGLGVAEVLLISLVVLVATIVLAPFQLALVRLVEGARPRRWGRRRAVERQRRRREAWQRRAEPPSALSPSSPPSALSPSSPPSAVAGPDAAAVQQAGVAEAAWRARFPSADHLTCPTAFGNVLAAMEDTAGRAYGHDAAVTWPRLYLLLDDKVRAAVDQRRNAMDASVRMCATGLLAALVAVAMLTPHGGWWVFLALAPLAVAIAAYQGAVHGALAYAESVHVAYDLCRFNLLTALHLELPADVAADKALNRALSEFWRQNVPLPEGSRGYHHGSTKGPGGGG